jgi:RNA polymerase sigma-70 factor (ECF subfamily)
MRSAGRWKIGFGSNFPNNSYQREYSAGFLSLNNVGFDVTHSDHRPKDDSVFTPSTPQSIDEQLPAFVDEHALIGQGAIIESGLGLMVDGSLAAPDVELISDVNNRREKMDHSKRLVLTERLLDQHHDSVYRYAYFLSGCSNSAEDIVQEVFVKAFCNIHQLQSDEASLSWLLTIARREFFRHQRSRFLGLQSDEIDESSSIACHEQSIDRQEWVAHAVDQLPIEFRVVVLMFYFEQKNYSEISRELDIPLGTVMSRLNRARKHLKESLRAASEPVPNGSCNFG